MTAPNYSDFGVTVHAGDCIEVLAGLPDASVHSVVTDPPYSLEFMGRAWDRHESPAMFQVWCTAWATECLRVLKPGGHVLAFGGSRTWHRLAVAVEDAGFEMRDSMAWLYASGFPKSLDVSRAIDKAGGASPEVQARVLREARARAGLSREHVAAAVGCTPSSIRDWEEGRARAVGRPVEFITPSPQYRDKLAETLGYTADERRVTGSRLDRRGDGTVIGLGHSGVEYGGASTPAARHWDGWGTALKPAFEPIVVARKPLAGTVAATVLEHGTGALNIDGCRVSGPPSALKPYTRGTANTIYNGTKSGPDTMLGVGAQVNYVQPEGGRWPSNVVLTHAANPDGVDLCGDGCVLGCPVLELDETAGIRASGLGVGERGRRPRGMGEVGERGGDPRPNGPTYGDSGGASRFFPVFRFEAKAPASERPRVGGVAHPTVKPLALMRWLVRLVTPPGGTVLDPFLGSGTTAHAARAEGFQCIGIERDETYLPLIKARLDGTTPDLFGGVA